MKIEKVETLLFRACRNYLLVKIVTDDGYVGYGDATLNGREMVVKSLVDTYLSELIIGHDASCINDIWQMVYIGAYWRGGPVFMTALAGIDMALWDIKGKRANCSLCNLIGGKARENIEVYCHVHGQNADELIENISEKRSQGFRVLRYSFDTKDNESKMVYKQPHQDINKGHIECNSVESLTGCWDSRVYSNDLIDVTRRIRERYGESIGLIHDIHGRLTVSQAVGVCKELDPFHLLFIEDPIDSKNTEGLDVLSKHSATPVGIGELFNSIDECKAIISKQEIGYLRIDISHFGGITPALKAAAFADVFGIKVAFHGPSDISPIAHAACYQIDSAISNFGVQEYVAFEDEVMDIFKIPYKIKEGFVTITETPGLGVSVDEEKLKLCEGYKKSYLPMLRDRMNAMHNW